MNGGQIKVASGGCTSSFVMPWLDSGSCGRHFHKWPDLLLSFRYLSSPTLRSQTLIALFRAHGHRPTPSPMTPRAVTRSPRRHGQLETHSRFPRPRALGIRSEAGVHARLVHSWSIKQPHQRDLETASSTHLGLERAEATRLPR